MLGVDFGKEDHLLHELSLGETLLNEEIVLLMHGAVATLARSGEDLETTSQTVKATQIVRIMAVIDLLQTHSII